MQAGRRKQQKGFGRCFWCLDVLKNHGTSGKTALQSPHAAFILTLMHYLTVPLSAHATTCVSLVPVYHLFTGLKAFQTKGHGKWNSQKIDHSMHVVGLTKVWSFEKWKKPQLLSLNWRVSDGRRTHCLCGKHRSNSFHHSKSCLSLQLQVDFSEYPTIILYSLRKQKRLLQETITGWNCSIMHLALEGTWNRRVTEKGLCTSKRKSLFKLLVSWWSV